MSYSKKRLQTDVSETLVFYSATAKKIDGENYISFECNAVKVIWMCLPSSYGTQVLPHVTLIYKTNPFSFRYQVMGNVIKMKIFSSPIGNLEIQSMFTTCLFIRP